MSNLGKYGMYQLLLSSLPIGCYLLPHQGWIAARAPNRQNSKHRRNKFIFSDFFGPWKKWPGMAPNGARRIFFLLIQTLPTFWAERILILRIFIFWIFCVPNFWLGPSLGPAWARLGPRHGPGSEVSSPPAAQLNFPEIWPGPGPVSKMCFHNAISFSRSCCRWL